MKLGPRITVWRAEDIWSLIDRGTDKQHDDELAGPDRSHQGDAAATATSGTGVLRPTGDPGRPQDKATGAAA